MSAYPVAWYVEYGPGLRSPALWDVEKARALARALGGLVRALYAL